MCGISSTSTSNAFAKNRHCEAIQNYSFFFFFTPTPFMAGGPWRADAVAETTCNLWSSGKPGLRGERSRLALAQSLIHGPSVSLCFLWDRENLRLFPSTALREFCWNVTCSPLSIFNVHLHPWTWWGCNPPHPPASQEKLAWKWTFLRLL